MVPGEGPAHARVMLVGQNPGREEVRQGRPFVGRSGKYLDAVLKKHGIDRGGLFITSVVKEATAGNRRPTAGEVKRWLPRLLEELDRVKPQIVVLMGKVAWRVPRVEGVRYIETYHPAAAMRFPGARQRFENDIECLKEDVERLGLHPSTAALRVMGSCSR